MMTCNKRAFTMTALFFIAAVIILLDIQPAKASLIYDTDKHYAINAIAEGELTTLKKLIERRSDLLEPHQGLLHFAARHGQMNIVEYLLSMGLDANGRAYDRETPLHEAANQGNCEVAALLLRKGADVNARDSNDRTPLQLAEEEGLKEIADYLRMYEGK